MKWKRFHEDRSGATAIEFAFVCFPMLLVFLGTFEFARALQTNGNLSYAAGVGSRAIMTDNAISETDLSTKIRAAFFGGRADRLRITFGNAVEGGIAFRTVTLSYPFDFVVSAVSDASIELSVSRRVPTE
ncbi:TadE/TadG family type IV pilus assembly protein [Fulvimarina sp. 2208YS6-2-32]|uniref:TadE/TadG family type IV pilus assembly protein n=1 Tax=Fulvimarina uroteuthidis TaxID=3098149 RepID=A0ABU5I7F0_9HYPH|nr:TadE/TadG family type IV pilus assembly protein [Fulvimarina sp. 2208YS6-2-32]MDY8110121.1 TadE/TadG family type IV pilus assembly protein [Fulvimarina sp. 2208YS6-2-32]